MSRRFEIDIVWSSAARMRGTVFLWDGKHHVHKRLFAVTPARAVFAAIAVVESAIVLTCIVLR